MQHLKTQSLSAKARVILMLISLLILSEGCLSIDPHLGRDSYFMKHSAAGSVIIPMEAMSGEGYCHNSDGSFTNQKFTVDIRREINVGREFKFLSNQIKLTKSLVFKAMVPGKTASDPLVAVDSLTLDKNETIELGPVWVQPIPKNQAITEEAPPVEVPTK